MTNDKESSCWGDVQYEETQYSGKETINERRLHVRFLHILDRIRYKDWQKRLTCKGGQFYFQWVWSDVCNFTGKPMLSRSGKYSLSEYMTETEIVNRLFLAAVKSEEHETREKFLYRPENQTEMKAPYNTHIGIDALYGIAEQFDKRKDNS